MQNIEKRFRNGAFSELLEDQSGGKRKGMSQNVCRISGKEIGHFSGKLHRLSFFCLNAKRYERNMSFLMGFFLCRKVDLL